MELVVVYLAAIAVGHRVKVSWFALEEPGLAGQTRTDERPHQPSITDLDTGVEYGTDWSVGADRRKYPDQPYTVSEGLREGLSVQREVVGRVTRCRVVTVRGYPDTDVQTYLTIEPE